MQSTVLKYMFDRKLARLNHLEYTVFSIYTFNLLSVNKHLLFGPGVALGLFQLAYI